MISNRPRFSFGAAAALAVILVACGSLALAEGQHDNSRPLTAADFKYGAPRGFGDRANGWPQSMVWWHDHLYVGTARESLCTSIFAIWRFIAGVLGTQAADVYMPYPPRDPDLACAPDGADLSLQAEIWRWTPGTNTWDRVFQSPLDLDNPGPPPEPGKKVPYEITIRGMAPHVDPDGTEALYAFGVNSGVLWDTTKIPPPRILRTTDGVTWTPVPQTPGTFLSSLPFNRDHTSFRSPASFNGKLFVLSGPIFGQGSLIASADPAKGDDSWFLAAPANVLFYEMGTFNGWLYLGTISAIGNGYSVVKTRAEGPPPYQFVTVIPPGAYHPDPLRASRSVVSMNEYQGRLYIGTATMTEVVRINPDDTWDVVVGPPRVVPTPDGGVEWKYPLSGLDNGFGHTPNDHVWQMGDVSGDLFLGTYNSTTGTRNDPVIGPKLIHNMGAHLYRTSEGWYYSAITTNGFANLGDPMGGKFDYGIRSIVNTPHGVFLGLTNDHFGLSIIRGNTSVGQRTIPPPARLEVEPLRTGAALLSWQRVQPVKRTHIFRAERLPVAFRTDINIESWTNIYGNLLPDIYVGPYEEIGVTDEWFFVDHTVQPGKLYMYYAVQEHNLLMSDQSNLVSFPLLTPAMTFMQLSQEIDKMLSRGRLTHAESVRALVATARNAASACEIGLALKVLAPQKMSTMALFPESIDVEVMASKLSRRLTLFNKFPSDLITAEFCSP